MSGGSVLQLAAIGLQNSVLTYEPEITFWKSRYARHSMFAIEAIEMPFTATFGSTAQVTAQRAGDLINEVFFCCDVPRERCTRDAPGTGTVVPTDADFGGAAPYYADALGFALLEEVQVNIGGTQFDKHYGDFMNIWDELSVPAGKERDESIAKGTASSRQLLAYKGFTLYVPFMFWFTEFSEQSLPVIALQFHEIIFKVKLRAATDLVVFNAAPFGAAPAQQYTLSTAVASLALTNCRLLINYVYLDTQERRIFARARHQYLITSLQYTSEKPYAATDTSVQVNLEWNHPVKEIIWVLQENANVGTTHVNKTYFEYGITDDVLPSGKTDIMASCLLKLNNVDRFARQNAIFFRDVQPRLYHSRIPKGKFIYVYAFALQPQHWKPSGNLNFSRIDRASLNINLKLAADGVTLGGGVVRAYGLAQNVLVLFFLRKLLTGRKNSQPNVCGYRLETPVVLPPWGSLPLEVSC